MKRNTIIVILLVILLIVLVYTNIKNEHLTSQSLTPQSNEAIQSVASVFNKQQMVLDNLNITQQINGLILKENWNIIISNE